MKLKSPQVVARCRKFQLLTYGKEKTNGLMMKLRKLNSYVFQHLN